MKLEKAIENNKDILARGSMISDLKDNQSIKLGIEALKRVKFHRESSLADAHIRLLGETEE